LFTQEIYAKEETFWISSSRTLEEDHEAQQESRHAMNMTPNDPRTEASTCNSSGTQPGNDEAWMQDSSLNREGNDIKGPHASAHK
jgi:hypothetical protein